MRKLKLLVLGAVSVAEFVILVNIWVVVALKGRDQTESLLLPPREEVDKEILSEDSVREHSEGEVVDSSNSLAVDSDLLSGLRTVSEEVLSCAERFSSEVEVREGLRLFVVVASAFKNIRQRCNNSKDSFPLQI